MVFNFEFLLSILCIHISFQQKDESIRKKHEAKKLAMRNFNNISVVHIFITKGFPYLAEFNLKSTINMSEWSTLFCISKTLYKDEPKCISM